jgi:hypothetical protein
MEYEPFITLKNKQYLVIYQEKKHITKYSPF